MIGNEPFPTPLAVTAAIGVTIKDLDRRGLTSRWTGLVLKLENPICALRRLTLIADGMKEISTLRGDDAAKLISPLWRMRLKCLETRMK